MLTLTRMLLAWALLLQTLEFVLLYRRRRHEIWFWSVTRREFAGFPAPVRWVLDALLEDPFLLLLLRALTCLALFVTPAGGVIWILFGSSVLLLLRYRGTFNGGSDFMSLVLQVAFCWGAQACLFYIAVQVCTSYFLAGVVKIQNAEWRNGKALGGFLSATIYREDKITAQLVRSPKLLWLASWGVMMFECLFPFSLTHPAVCAGFLVVGFLFHLGNAYILGLNRFFWIWMAGYPSVYFLTQRM